MIQAAHCKGRMPGSPPDAPHTFQGAKGDGQASDTAAIQAAIDSCAARPSGGVVLLEANSTYLTGTLRLDSGVRLHIPAGATLLADLQVRGPRARWPLVAFQPGLRCTHATQHSLQRSQYHPATGDDWHMVLLRQCTRCSVEGGGRIDGRGAAWGCAGPLLAPAAAARARAWPAAAQLRVHAQARQCKGRSALRQQPRMRAKAGRRR